MFPNLLRSLQIFLPAFFDPYASSLLILQTLSRFTRSKDTALAHVAATCGP